MMIERDCCGKLMGFNIDILKKTLGLNFGNIKNTFFFF